jgi:monoamine oxidase
VPLLTGWAGGSQAFALGDHSEEALVDEAIRSLSLILGFSRSMIEHELEAWHFHDWQNDPYSRGAYSYVGVNGINARRNLAEPLKETLFFAGEATHYSGQSGTVDGAIDTGVAAGRAAIQALFSSGRASRSA